MTRGKVKKATAQHVRKNGLNNNHGLVSMRLYLCIKMYLIFKNGSLDTCNLEFVQQTTCTLLSSSIQLRPTSGKYLPNYQTNTALLTAGYN